MIDYLEIVRVSNGYVVKYKPANKDPQKTLIFNTLKEILEWLAK